MNERLIRPVPNGNEEVFEIQIKREFRIPKTRWEAEEKKFIFFDLNGIERSFLTRKVENFCLPRLEGFGFKDLNYSGTYFTAWKILKDRGFNVVEEVWKLGETKVATTNLIENGGSVYDRKIDAVVERYPLEMDSDFINLSMVSVQKEAYKLADLANGSGVELMPDGPFHIIVKPDKSWNLTVLDIGKIRILKNPRALENWAKHNNTYEMDNSLRIFGRIQENIRTLRLARGLV